jgi:hypothetical protein
MSKAKLLKEAMFFIIIFTYLKKIYKSKWPWSLSRLVPCLKWIKLSCQALLGHFGPLYLLQVSKKDDEECCF